MRKVTGPLAVVSCWCVGPSQTSEVFPNFGVCNSKLGHYPFGIDVYICSHIHQNVNNVCPVLMLAPIRDSGDTKSCYEI